MSEPRRVLVPLAPDGETDIGFAVASLIPCERVSLLARTPEELTAVLDWFVAPGEVETLLIWLRDGVIDWIDVAGGDFRKAFFEHPVVAKLLHGQHRHSRFVKYSGVRQASVEGAEPTFVAVARALNLDLYLPTASVDAASAALLSLPGCRETRTDRIQTEILDLAGAVNAKQASLRDVIRARRAAASLRSRIGGAAIDLGGPREMTVRRFDCGSWSPAIIRV
ncbi:MAG: hypothetical protein ABW136_13110 [Steroidobacteraceae bacterium]